MKLECYERALAVVKKSNLDESREALCLSGIAEIYRRVELTPLALPLLERVLEIDTKAGDPVAISESTGNLANAYHALGEYRRALELHRKALTGLRIPEMIMGELSPTTKALAIELLNTGMTYAQLEEHEEALDCLRESLALFRRASRRPNFDEYGGVGGFVMSMVSAGGSEHMPSPFIRHEVMTLVNISRSASRTGKLEEARSAHEEALGLVRRYALDEFSDEIGGLY